MTEIRRVVFNGPILQNGGMNAGYIHFPFSVEDLYGVSGQVKVKVVFDRTLEYKGSLVRMETEGHILGISKEVRRKINKTFGDTICVEVIPDLDKRTIDLPDEIRLALEKYPSALAKFETLSFTHQREYVEWINTAKKDETKKKRLAQLVDKMRGDLKR